MALQLGSRRAKEIIARQMLNVILVPVAKKLIQDATHARISIGHNMTGDTVNSYAVGIYVAGRLVHIETPTGSIPRPLRHKLNRGERFYAGSQRWDGDIQESTFKASISTNGTIEAERSIAFLQSHKPSGNGWSLVVCNGVEYASYQETEMNIDVLTSSFDYAKMFLPSMFKPMPPQS